MLPKVYEIFKNETYLVLNFQAINPCKFWDLTKAKTKHKIHKVIDYIVKEMSYFNDSHELYRMLAINHDSYYGSVCNNKINNDFDWVLDYQIRYSYDYYKKRQVYQRKLKKVFISIYLDYKYSMFLQSSRKWKYDSSLQQYYLTTISLSFRGDNIFGVKAEDTQDHDTGLTDFLKWFNLELRSAVLNKYAKRRLEQLRSLINA